MRSNVGGPRLARLKRLEREAWPSRRQEVQARGVKFLDIPLRTAHDAHASCSRSYLLWRGFVPPPRMDVMHGIIAVYRDAGHSIESIDQCCCAQHVAVRLLVSSQNESAGHWHQQSTSSAHTHRHWGWATRKSQLLMLRSWNRDSAQLTSSHSLLNRHVFHTTSHRITSDGNRVGSKWSKWPLHLTVTVPIWYCPIPRPLPVPSLLAI